MEVQQALRLGYYHALNGNVSVDSKNIPVFDMGGVPESQAEPYIIISTTTSEQRFVDKVKVYECTQLVDIVTSSLSPSGFDKAMAIANEVEKIVNPDTFIDLDIKVYGYRIGNTFCISSDNNLIKTKTKYVYRVFKRYRHLISIHLNT